MHFLINLNHLINMHPTATAHISNFLFFKVLLPNISPQFCFILQQFLKSRAITVTLGRLANNAGHWSLQRALCLVLKAQEPIFSNSAQNDCPVARRCLRLLGT